MTVSMHRKFIGKRVIALFHILIAGSSLCWARAGEGKIDTIRVSRWQQASVAYHDSIVIYEEQPGIADPLARGYTRSIPTASWDSVALVSRWFRQLPMKGCVMMGRLDKRNDYGLHWILRDAKSAKVDTTGRAGDKITYQPIKRIRVHPANPSKVYIQYEYKTFGGTFSATMVTNDDGVTWSEINPPSFSNDGGRGHRLGFNYRQPQRTYVAVDPQNVVFPDEPFRAYYTDDDGLSFTQIEFSHEKSAPLFEIGVGIWSADRGFDIIADELPFYIDTMLANGQTVTQYKNMKWLERVRSTLLPNYDSSTQRLASGYEYSRGSDGYIDRFAFHPERPQTFALQFELDTLVGNKWLPRSFVAVTTDMGYTWNYVLTTNNISEITYQSVMSLIIDPLSNSVYCSYQNLVLDTITGITTYLNSYTIKWTPDVASSVDSPVAGRALSDIVAYPNPAPKNGTLNFLLPSALTKQRNEIPAVSFVSIDGMSFQMLVICDDAYHDGATKGDMPSLKVKVGNLAAGFYTAVVSVGSNRWVCHVIVSP